MTAKISEQSEPTLRILSLGAGVQSTTLALLSASGDLPKLDAAIFADTGAEPKSVYEHLDRLEREVLTPAGIPLYRVSYGNLGDDLLDPDRMAMIPAYTLGPAQERKVPTAWKPCTCEWARFRTAHVTFDDGITVEPHIADFDDFASFPPRATVIELQKYIEQPLRTDPDDPTLYTAEWFRHEAAGRVVAAMVSLGMDRLPDPHEECGSLGRIPTAWRTEITRPKGMLGRKCTQRYKLSPLLAQVRLLLGAEVSETPCRYCHATGERIAPWRAKRGENVIGTCSVCRGSGTIRRVGQPPSGAWAEQWIGFSTDEITRVSTNGDTRYSRSRYPLLELDMSREQCNAFLKRHGWTSVAKSACTFCPYRGNREWRQLRDNAPKDWQAAVEFDEAYRNGAGMRGERYLHISTKPLAEAPIDLIRPSERQQLNLIDLDFERRMKDGDPDGCSPWGCRSGEPVVVDESDDDERLAS